jgi:hypothetical protein
MDSLACRLFGTEQEPIDAVAQIGGEALSMSTKDFLHTSEDATIGLRVILLLYAPGLLSQVVHNAACNRAHSIEQRCARWILMTHYRTRKESFFLGHRFISYMLVVPQATVNRAMETLANAKLITYTYDRIDILNRQQLEKASCVCYCDIKRGYDRILDAAVSLKRGVSSLNARRQQRPGPPVRITPDLSWPGV